LNYGFLAVLGICDILVQIRIQLRIRIHTSG
jgi:hypothetical protein